VFTRREKIVLGIFCVAAAVVFPIAYFFPDAISNYEFIYFLVVVVPVGLLLATDKERIDKSKNNQ